MFDEMTIIRSSYSSNSLDGSGGDDGALFDIVYQALLSMSDFCTHFPLLRKLQSAFPIFSLLETKTFPKRFSSRKNSRGLSGFLKTMGTIFLLHYLLSDIFIGVNHSRDGCYNSYFASSLFCSIQKNQKQKPNDKPHVASLDLGCTVAESTNLRQCWQTPF